MYIYNSDGTISLEWAVRVPDVLCPNLFVTKRFVPCVYKWVKVRYLGSELGLVLALELGVSVRVLRVGVRVGIMVKVRYAEGTKRMSTKRLGYEMCGSRQFVWQLMVTSGENESV